MLANEIDILQSKSAKKVGASFIVWSKDQIDVKKRQRLDPNYLMPDQFSDSAFHRAIHLFMLRNQGKPLMHIDIHGKNDRKNNSEVDLGIKQLEKMLPESQQETFVQPLINQFRSKMNKIFKGVRARNFQVWFNHKIETLTGYWNTGP